MTFAAIRPPQIKPGVFFAPVAGEGVLLDLPANRYLGLTPLSARLWSVIGSGGFPGNLLQVAAPPHGLSNLPPPKSVQQQIAPWGKARPLGSHLGESPPRLSGPPPRTFAAH